MLSGFTFRFFQFQPYYDSGMHSLQREGLLPRYPGSEGWEVGEDITIWRYVMLSFRSFILEIQFHCLFFVHDPEVYFWPIYDGSRRVYFSGLMLNHCYRHSISRQFQSRTVIPLLLILKLTFENHFQLQIMKNGCVKFAFIFVLVVEILP